MCADFNIDAMFGNETPTISHAAARNLHSSNPCDNGKCISTAHAHLSSNNIFNKCMQLTNIAQASSDLVESTDRQLGRAMQAGEKQCKKKQAVPWSPHLHQAKTKVRILEAAQSQVNTRMDHSATIESLQSYLPFPIRVPSNMQELKQQLLNARKEHKKLLHTAEESRKKHLEERLTAHASAGDEDKKKILKRIMKAEAIKAMYKKLRFLKKNSINEGMSMLLVPEDQQDDPNTCQNWKQVDMPRDIESCLFQRNRKHFGKAHGTPFTVEPLQTEINFEANTTTCELILDGTCEGDHEELVNNLLKHLKTSENIAMVQTETSMDEFKQKLKFWDECTSTSPSGRHLGHCHSLTKPVKPPAECEDYDTALQTLQHQREETLQCHLAVINYALRTGCALERCKNIVNVVIEKDKGIPKIHRLRVIHLFEADCNLTLSMKWRKLLQNECNQHLFNAGQFALPNKQHLEPIFTEELQNEINHMARKSQIKFANDAKSCCGRMISGLVNLISRKFGMPKTMCMTQGNALKEAQYRLKTMFGMSDSSHAHCQAHPLHGTGQGSGSSPVLWVVTSSILFDIHQIKGNGASYTSPDKEISAQFNMLGFVDDSAGQVNLFMDNDQSQVERLARLMEEDTQLWSDFLQTSGGASELSKCSYHVTSCGFCQVGTPVLKGHQDKVKIRVTGPSGTEHINQLSPCTSHRTLGAFKSPSGNQEPPRSSKHKTMKQKSDQMARQLSLSSCNANDAHAFCHAMCLPSIGHALPMCFFSEQELNKTQSRAVGTTLRKSHFPRNTERATVFGPQRFGGKAWRHLHAEQGMGQIIFFLKHWRSQGLCTSMLETSTRWAQFQTGLRSNLFEDTTASMNHLESKWLKSLRQHLCQIGGKMVFEHSIVPPMQRENDEHLMQAAVDKGCSARELRCVNCCRLYLEVITVLDIATANGKSISVAHAKDEKQDTNNHSLYVPTNQAKPSQVAWNVWSKLCSDLNNNDEGLSVPLGVWTVPASKRRMRWARHYDVKDGRVCDHQQDYCSIKDMHNLMTEVDASEFLPDTCVPFGDEDELHEIARDEDNAARQIDLLAPDPVATTFGECLAQQCESDRFLSQGLFLCMEPFQIAQTMQSEKCLLVSDGSSSVGKGTCGWVLADEQGNCLAESNGPVGSTNPSSCRSECVGMTSSVRFVYLLMSFTGNIHQGDMHHCCDNKSLVDKLNKWKKCKKIAAKLTLESDWDCLQLTLNTQQKFNVPGAFVHVKGHQDDTRAVCDLSVPAQLNVCADSLATMACQQHDCNVRCPVLLGSKVQFLLHDDLVKTKCKQKIRFSDRAPMLQQSMMKREGWSESVFNMVDWTSFSQALKDHRTHESTLIKSGHHQLPVGRLLHKRDGKHSHACPTCGRDNETWQHLFQCTHPDREEWRLKTLRKMRKHMDDVTTDPHLQEMFLEGLECWMRGTELNREKHLARHRELVTQQDSIGWDNLLKGRLANQWKKKQTEHLQSLNIENPERKGKQWPRLIVHVLWDKFLELWQARNQHKHGLDTCSKSIAKRNQVLLELQMAYAKRHLMRPSDKRIFQSTHEAHSTLSTISMSNWLAAFGGVIKRSVDRFKKMP